MFVSTETGLKLKEEYTPVYPFAIDVSDLGLPPRRHTGDSITQRVLMGKTYFFFIGVLLIYILNVFDYRCSSTNQY